MPFGNSTFSDAGGAVGDLFAASADRLKAQGSRIQAQNYGNAAVLADQNAAFTERSTAIQEMQQQRKNYLAEGSTEAAVAGAGFAASGTGLDIMRSNAEQAALSKAVLGEQGYITEQGYQEQASSYRNMEKASELEAEAQDKAATGATWAAGISAAASAATLFTGGPAGGAGLSSITSRIGL